MQKQAKDAVLDVKLVEKNNDFYIQLGPYLASRNVFNEIGYPVLDDEKTHWWIAVCGNDLAGFATVRVSTKSVSIGVMYSTPSYRRLGAQKAIITGVIRHYKQPVIRVTCNEHSAGLIKKFGFTATRSTKRFITMELNRA